MEKLLPIKPSVAKGMMELFPDIISMLFFAIKVVMEKVQRYFPFTLSPPQGIAYLQTGNQFFPEIIGFVGFASADSPRGPRLNCVAGPMSDIALLAPIRVFKPLDKLPCSLGGRLPCP